jgi:hypothetical protein
MFRSVSGSWVMRQFGEDDVRGPGTATDAEVHRGCTCVGGTGTLRGVQGGGQDLAQ